MNCGEIRDLLAAYSLGTVTAEESATVEQHLAICHLDHGLAEQVQIADLLAFSVPARMPPSSLRDRVLASTSGRTPYMQPMPAPAPGQFWRRWLRGPYAIAASLAVLVIVMAVWNITLQARDGDQKVVRYHIDGEGNWLQLDTVIGEPGAEVAVGGLTRLPAGSHYQLWTTRNETALPVGMFNTSAEGQWSGAFDFTFASGDNLWITVEPEIGGTLPTGDALLQTGNLCCDSNAGETVWVDGS